MTVSSSEFAATDNVVSTLKRALQELNPVLEPSAPVAPLEGVGINSLQIQLSALHKGFLALSDAFLENVEAHRRNASALESQLASTRREFEAKLELEAELHEDVQELARLNAGLHAENAALERRMREMEARLHDVEGMQARQEAELASELAGAADRQVSAAAEAWQRSTLPKATARAGRRWAQEALPALAEQSVRGVAARAVHDALRAGLRANVSATMEAREEAKRASAQAQAASTRLERLSEKSARLGAQHSNHDARLRVLESGALGAARRDAELGPGAPSLAPSPAAPRETPASPGLPGGRQVAALGRRVDELERHAQSLAASTAEAVDSVVAEVDAVAGFARGLEDQIRALELRGGESLHLERRAGAATHKTPPRPAREARAEEEPRWVLSAPRRGVAA